MVRIGCRGGVEGVLRIGCEGVLRGVEGVLSGC